jgi:hypothetical protein
LATRLCQQSGKSDGDGDDGKIAFIVVTESLAIPTKLPALSGRTFAAGFRKRLALVLAEGAVWHS